MGSIQYVCMYVMYVMYNEHSVGMSTVSLAGEGGGEGGRKILLVFH